MKNNRSILAKVVEVIALICMGFSVFYVLISLLTGCAPVGGERPQMPAPQAAQPYAQPTIKSLGQPQLEQPGAAQPTLKPLIEERPSLLAATPTSEPVGQQPQTAIERVADAQQKALKAQELLDDCNELSARESAMGWVVDCTPLVNNLTEANRRLSESMEAAKTEGSQ